MAQISIDLSGIVTREFEALPAGRYPVEVLDVTREISKNGNPMLNWQFSVVGGEFDGRRLFTNTMLMDSSLWKLRMFLLALGYDEADLEGPIELELEELIGLTALARVAQRVYEGELRNEIRALSPLEELRVA